VSDQKEWFSEWFDSPYYHILYQNRDDKEAEFFLSNLITFFKAKREWKIIDLACGKGRHAIFLNSLGYDVTGIDLSSKSIAIAKKSENENLHFEVQDLRHLKFKEKFDIALNLFTSFGYFRSKEEDAIVIKNIHHILKPKGFVLIDFMNTGVVLRNLVAKENKLVCGIHFQISKKKENGFIVKNIHFCDKNKEYEYSEKVQTLSSSDFEKLLTDHGFSILNLFGNYKLDEFRSESSERLIILAQKNA